MAFFVSDCRPGKFEEDVYIYIQSLIDYCNGSVEIIENILRPGEFSSHVDAVNLLRRPWHFCDVMLLHQGEALALITTAKAQQGQETFRKKVMAIVGATS